LRVFVFGNYPKYLHKIISFEMNHNSFRRYIYCFERHIPRIVRIRYTILFQSCWKTPLFLPDSFEVLYLGVMNFLTSFHKGSVSGGCFWRRRVKQSWEGESVVEG
jgi:hypothetical protein